MIDKTLVDRLMQTIEENYRKVFPFVVPTDIKVDDISSGLAAIKYHAEALEKNIAEEAPDLDKLLKERQQAQAELAKLQADVADSDVNDSTRRVVSTATLFIVPCRVTCLQIHHRPDPIVQG